MNKLIKTQENKVLIFWNDTHKLTMLFEPIEEPEPIIPEIPTSILLKEIMNLVPLPKTPTDINAIYLN